MQFRREVEPFNEDFACREQFCLINVSSISFEAWIAVRRERGILSGNGPMSRMGGRGNESNQKENSVGGCFALAGRVTSAGHKNIQILQLRIVITRG